MSKPRIVVVGAGFAGLATVKALRRADADITLIDRKNHHVFQPLLYQVATAALSPADIAAPIRRIFKRQRNAWVALAEVTHIDPEQKLVHVRAPREVSDESGAIPYDYLVLAAGATHSYFGNDHWALHAPGLKTVEDAIEIRRRVLLAFERAEMTQSDEERRAAMTFVVVGAGATGVEMAGAMAEIALKVVRDDYRFIDTASAQIILVEAADRVLPTMDEICSRRALDQLRGLGVTVRLNERVTSVDATGVEIEGSHLPALTVIWAAGVKGSPLAEQLGVEPTHGGRVEVNADLSVPGAPDTFVVGDLARVETSAGKEVPGVAPAAMQMGKYVGKLIDARIRAKQHPNEFRYRDKGMLATIGRHRATGSIFGRRVHGFIAWFLWAAVHLFFLIGFRNRLIVMIQWAITYITHRRGARLITEDKPDRAEEAPRSV